MKQETVLNIRYGNTTYSYTLEEYLEEGKDEVTIGRGMDCDIIIRNSRVAEKHGCFFLGKDGWVYRDLGSEVGSSMNGTKINWVKIFNGSTIALAAFPNPETLFIDITVKNDGFPVVPGRPAVSPLSGANISGPSMTGANSGSFAGTGTGAMSYGFDNNNSGNPQAQNNSFAGSSFAGTAEDNYRSDIFRSEMSGDRRSDAFAGRTESSMTGLNAFGLGAALAWSIIGVVYLINFFRTISALNNVNIFYSFSTGIMTVAMFIMYMVTVGGMVLLPISLFTYRKRNMYLGAQMIAAGFTGMMVATMLLYMFGLGSLFWYLLSNKYFVLLLLVTIFNLMAFISLAGLFKKNADMEKVNDTWYRPIIFYGVSWLISLLTIALSANEYSSVYGTKLSLTDSLPSDNIWMAIAWFAAVILSCVHIHVEETPALAEKYEIIHR
ncbi:MAG: FHA domain-containing protein [Eubacterium sp.]|nr:FHA domain-containing protein [Eubacterium sp.]